MAECVLEKALGASHGSPYEIPSDAQAPIFMAGRHALPPCPMSSAAA
jgi:hypothetical protein